MRRIRAPTGLRRAVAGYRRAAEQLPCVSDRVRKALKGVAVEAHVGDRITIESNRVGGGTRSGEIIEVVDEQEARHYRVRWDDGRETVYYPKAGSIVADPSR